MVLNASKSDIQSAPAQTILNTQGVYAKKPQTVAPKR